MLTENESMGSQMDRYFNNEIRAEITGSRISNSTPKPILSNAQKHKEIIRLKDTIETLTVCATSFSKMYYKLENDHDTLVATMLVNFGENGRVFKGIISKEDQPYRMFMKVVEHYQFLLKSTQ